MAKILAKELKIKFVEILTELDDFKYEEGNPFLTEINTKKYFVFLKNISPAYFKNSPDITRVQLPYSSHFLKIIKENIPFIIIGYDVDHDTMVAWNPKRIKERLNEKSNVSLYSRSSLQSRVRRGEFKDGYLSNGEKIILFKREMLNSFFENLGKLFSNYTKSSNIENISEPEVVYETQKKDIVIDKIVINKVIPLLQKNRVLEAVSYCDHYYKDKYKSMTFKDWFDEINIIYKKL